MDLPKFQQWQALELLDYGGCGEVYLARDANDEAAALKCLEDLTVSRRLLEKMAQRLEADAWPEGVVPLLARSLERNELKWVTPLYADWDEDQGWRSRSLQQRLGDYPKKDAWPLILELARTLARMHAKHVPHGNLKPGNVFFDKDDKPLLSDWCLGNVPGVHVFNFTDALLYQPPEQLLDSSGYLDEQGYGWDVFAFGVLAYRLLTGRFPRCDDVFGKVAPPPGVTRCEGLRADPDIVAENLRDAPDPRWLEYAPGEFEERQREWIMRCLAIDPNHRPSSMGEVAAGLEAIETELEQEHEYQRVVSLHRRAKFYVSALLITLACCAFAIVSLAIMWRGSEAIRKKEKARIQVQRLDLTQARELAEKNEGIARAAEKALKEQLAQASEHYRSQLGASRQIGDRLFAWAMEKDRRQLPPLDGREQRLKQLEQDLLAFVTEAKKLPELAEQLALARLQLAEIAISLGQTKLARERFLAAYESWKNKPMGAELKMRLATDSLRIAKLMEGKAETKATMESFALARDLLGQLDVEQVSKDRLDHLSAVLQYREAKLLAQKGNEVEALGQLMKATETLNLISSQRPDVALLHSALADCYLSSASILEGIGKPGDAREVRMLAVGELLTLRKAKPHDLDVQSQLAACYSAMAEASFLSGDLQGAEQRVEDGLALLKAYLSQRPRDNDAIVHKASLYGLKAGILRDRGKAEQSIELYNEALALLEAVTKQKPEHAMASYRLALTWWQKGRMLGMTGNSAAEIGFLAKAASRLQELQGGGEYNGPGPEQLLRSRAYLAGDIGHARDLSGDKQAARVSLKEALELWQQLREIRPRSEEYEQAEQWCRERLERMK